MTNRPARITQAEVARIIRAAKQAGASEVVIRGAGRPDLRLSLSRDVGAVGDQIAAHLARPPESSIAREGPTTLYRHFDEDGRLLYVGISCDVWRRQADHSNRSHCYDLSVRIETEEYRGRFAAEVAERHAIQTEKPLHNIAGRAA